MNSASVAITLAYVARDRIQLSTRTSARIGRGAGDVRSARGVWIAALRRHHGPERIGRASGGVRETVPETPVAIFRTGAGGGERQPAALGRQRLQREHLP